ncbi:uncharacterized protein LOC124921854 isoform X2 [Impatiens glandulifera]|uniref:uncharacterized protein LOC124921854 isoform X2 n=1 Tax=Impatiens glandulifera TaxID=253017 RepID=UPI001FB13EC7|nr:uncharacterized protein LOC124921854 isoform X2 [Impatiens glandulifera]
MEEIDNREKEKKKCKASTSRQHCVDSGAGVAAAEAPDGSSHGIPEEDLEMYMSDKELCIKCNRGGRLFVCRELCCPIAVHKKCMPATLSIGGTDNFYCPYCTYRRAFIRTNETKKLVKDTKKTLSCFLIESSLTVNSQMQKTPEREASRPIILGEISSDGIAKQLNAADVCSDGIAKQLNAADVHAGQLKNDQVVERARKVVDEQQEKEEQNIPLVIEEAQLENSADSSRKRRREDDDLTVEQQEDIPKVQEHDEVNIKEKKGQKKKASKRTRCSSSSGVQTKIMEQKDKSPTSNKTRSTGVEHEDEKAHQLNLEPSLKGNVKVEQREISTTNSSDFKPLSLGRKKCRWSSEEEEMLKGLRNSQQK